MCNELKHKILSVSYQKYLSLFHPAGDVTRVSVMPRKVTVKIGMPRIGVGDAEIKINEKGQEFLFI